MGGPYTRADFVRLALAEFPKLREEFEEYRDLLRLQMHAFERLAARAKAEGGLGDVHPLRWAAVAASL
jgi:hypothetical protein